MGFVNIDDNFPDHPKVDPLSDTAFRLHLAGICLSNRLMLDGIVPEGRVARLLPKFKQSAMNELLTAGLWRTHPEGYEIHVFLDWNLSKKQREERREKKRAAGRKGAQAKWHQ